MPGECAQNTCENLTSTSSLSEVYLGPCQTSMLGLLGKPQLKAVDYFHRSTHHRRLTGS